MKQRNLSLLAGTLMLFNGIVPTSALAALSAVGEPIDPHGFPAFYTDGNGLSLEPCLPPPAGYAGRADLCIADPVDPANPDSVALGVGGEVAWWMAEAIAPSLVPGGKSLLVLALEGAFVAEVPKDGEQLAFGRLRVRVDVPVAGTYTVTHPYGTLVFENVTVADGINYTADIGDINVIDPALGFAGALASGVGPFLTWPDYAAEDGLKRFALDALGQPTDVVLEQYVGDPNIPHVVTGSPLGTNLFRVVGPGGISTETALFSVVGKVYEPVVEPPRTVHLFPGATPQNLFAVGPVNRAGDVGVVTPQQPDGVRTGTAIAGYPVGFPLWYQENAGTAELPLGGLQLTLCPGTDPMCVSLPVDANDPGSVALGIGAEAFWWSADAVIDDRTPDVTNLPAGLEGQLAMAMESGFSGDGSIVDGRQIGAAILRIRIDVPTAGTYTVTHPYGVEVFENVPAGRRAINTTREYLFINAADPDSAFVGALYGDIGTRFLTWTTFNADPTLNDLALQRPHDINDPASPLVQYVGNPGVPHAVTGSPDGNNVFRIQGPGIDVQTELFEVSGKVYDPATFVPAVNLNAPVANADAAVTLTQTAVTIPVLANDTLLGSPVVPGATTVTLLPGTAAGAVALNGDNTVTYTPPAGFAGVDDFSYQIAVNGVISNAATVSIDVTPVEDITVRKARLDLRRLRFEIEGRSNVEGATLSASIDGTTVGSTVVRGGKWRLRVPATARPNVDTLTLTNTASGVSVAVPLNVR